MRSAWLIGGAALALTSAVVWAPEAPVDLLPPGFADPAPTPTPAPPAPRTPAPYTPATRPATAAPRLRASNCTFPGCVTYQFTAPVAGSAEIIMYPSFFAGVEATIYCRFVQVLPSRA